jgi:hypothetical protein
MSLSNFIGELFIEKKLSEGTAPGRKEGYVVGEREQSDDAEKRRGGESGTRILCGECDFCR